MNMPSIKGATQVKPCSDGNLLDKPQ